MKKQMKIAFVVAVFIAAAINCYCQTKVEIKDNWYYVNGEKYFIKAIGYEIGARPGQDPKGHEIRDFARMKYDLKVIKDAGYNAIRTWDSYSEEQLKLVQQSGLKLIMGIWISPEGEFGNPEFIKKSENIVKNVMKYAKKYDCIISYLIMNEPQTDHIYKSGGKNMVNLFNNLIGIIHKEHPGIPVSISANNAISDFMNENIFDFYAYNSYDYNEGQNATAGYAGFLKWNVESNGQGKPLVITEFGYSISDLGYGKYGGNTLIWQKENVVRDYRELIDAGAIGACPFYYADGWWKGGDPKIHNNQPEGWFGFFGYSDINDTVGSPRPVWLALENYMKALVVTPKNQTVYTEKIPLELFVDKDIKKVIVRHDDKMIYSKQITKEGYLSDMINVQPNGIEDMELAFEFYDKNNKIVKTESIFVLVSKSPVDLPKMKIDIIPGDDLNKSQVCYMKVSIQNKTGFRIVDDYRYSFCQHLGWDAGPQGSTSLKENLDKNDFVVEHYSVIPDNCWVLTASAGVTIKYGKFTYRLNDHKLIFRGDWAKEIGRK